MHEKRTPRAKMAILSAPFFHLFFLPRIGAYDIIIVIIIIWFLKDGARPMCVRAVVFTRALSLSLFFSAPIENEPQEKWRE